MVVGNPVVVEFGPSFPVAVAGRRTGVEAGRQMWPALGNFRSLA